MFLFDCVYEMNLGRKHFSYLVFEAQQSGQPRHSEPAVVANHDGRRPPPPSSTGGREIRGAFKRIPKIVFLSDEEQIPPPTCFVMKRKFQTN